MACPDLPLLKDPRGMRSVSVGLPDRLLVPLPASEWAAEARRLVEFRFLRFVKAPLKIEGRRPRPEPLFSPTVERRPPGVRVLPPTLSTSDSIVGRRLVLREGGWSSVSSSSEAMAESSTWPSELSLSVRVSFSRNREAIDFRRSRWKGNGNQPQQGGPIGIIRPTLRSLGSSVGKPMLRSMKSS